MARTLGVTISLDRQVMLALALACQTIEDHVHDFPELTLAEDWVRHFMKEAAKLQKELEAEESAAEGNPTSAQGSDDPGTLDLPS